MSATIAATGAQPHVEMDIRRQHHRGEDEHGPEPDDAIHEHRDGLVAQQVAATHAVLADVHVLDRHHDQAGLQAGVEGGPLSALERQSGVGEQVDDADALRVAIAV